MSVFCRALLQTAPLLLHWLTVMSHGRGTPERLLHPAAKEHNREERGWSPKMAREQQDTN